MPSAIAAHENLATTASLYMDQIGVLQTVNNAPQGGHCEFDGKGFSSGIQVMAMLSLMTSSRVGARALVHPRILLKDCCIMDKLVEPAMS